MSRLTDGEVSKGLFKSTTGGLNGQPSVVKLGGEPKGPKSGPRVYDIEAERRFKDNFDNIDWSK